MAERMTRAQRRELTRTTLLDAAERLFAEHGVHGASLDDVAAAAGLTKGAVYSNFDGKAELLRALMERRQSRDVGFDAEAIIVDESREPRDRFRDLGAAYAEGVGQCDSRRYAMLLMEFWLYGMRDPAARTQAADVLRAVRSCTAEAIDRHDPEQLPLPARDLGAVATALEIGISVQHLIDPEEVPGELYGTAMALLFGGTQGSRDGEQPPDDSRAT